MLSLLIPKKANNPCDIHAHFPLWKKLLWHTQKYIYSIYMSLWYLHWCNIPSSLGVVQLMFIRYQQPDSHIIATLYGKVLTGIALKCQTRSVFVWILLKFSFTSYKHSQWATTHFSPLSFSLCLIWNWLHSGFGSFNINLHASQPWSYFCLHPIP